MSTQTLRVDRDVLVQPASSTMPDVELAPVRHIIRAIALTVVPESASLDDRGWSDFDDLVTSAFAKRDARVRRQVVRFLKLLQQLPIVRYGRPLTSLSPTRRQSFLEGIARSRLFLVRRRFWGVRTLVFLGYYSRHDAAESIGHRPSALGWMARGGTVSTVPMAPALWIEP